MSDDECREMFEAWCRTGDPEWFRRNTDGTYFASRTRYRFALWQAAWTARGEADAEANSNELRVKLKPGQLSPSSYEFRGDE